MLARAANPSEGGTIRRPHATPDGQTGKDTVRSRLTKAPPPIDQPIITGAGRKAALNPAFKWVNTTLGNIKSAITGTYRTIRDKHVPRYLAEFEYRFNRRYDLAAMMPRLGYVAARTPAMPYRLLKLAEDHA